MKTTNIVALDVGEKRVGLAIANHVARLPRPLTTLIRTEHFWQELKNILTKEAVDTIVVGLPRNLNGQETAQSLSSRSFIKELSKHTDIPIALQDETLSSREAEAELRARGKPFQKSDIDALAATLILEDFLNQNSLPRTK